MGSTFGELFRISTWGESHGKGVGVVVDGCPANLAISEEDIQYELDRRRPGQSDITTPRKEADSVEILSGVFDGKTTGTPISMMVRNKDHNSKAYDHLKDVYRPSHADYVYDQKYGHRDYRGGGRSSARETIGRVAAGAIAKAYLKQVGNIEILACVKQIHTIEASFDVTDLTLSSIEANDVRCPDEATAQIMIEAIKQARKDGDSLGGIVTCVAKHVPAGLGEPVFDKIKADLAKAMLSLPATMGFEIGSGFSSVSMTGAEHNDAILISDDQTVHTRTNYSGGTQGGITNGELIYFNTVFKPTATIFKTQDTISTDQKATTLAAKGRHDPCVVPRAIPIVESMCAIVIMDHWLRQQARYPQWNQGSISANKSSL